MSKAIFKMNLDAGRQGSLEGIFSAEKEHVKILVEQEIEVYFGEVLGKHSEIHGTVEGARYLFCHMTASFARRTSPLMA